MARKKVLGNGFPTSKEKKVGKYWGAIAPEFAERVRLNQQQLRADLKGQYDFIVCGSGSSAIQSSDFIALLLRLKASPPRLFNDRERPEDHRARQRYCQRRIAGRIGFNQEFSVAESLLYMKPKPHTEMT